MHILNSINDVLWTYILIAVLLFAAIWFSVKTRFVQVRMLGEMIKLLCSSGKKEHSEVPSDSTGNEPHHHPRHSISSFQAFAVSIASRVGTGNLAGVATAIAIGGPGAVFWMWIIAILGASTAFIESTLAQIYKVKGKNSFRGGPAYYIQKGMGKRWFAVIFAILITLTFGLAFNSVQSNTIAMAAKVSFGWSPTLIGIILSCSTLIIIWGGIRRISKFSEVVVPIMAILYILLAIYIIIIRFDRIPHVLDLIFTEAFTGDAALGAGFGSAIIMGIKRGLFSNEAGEGSAPNVAATASVSHPVKQGLIQAFGVFTDTLLICSATAFIILCGGLYTGRASGIELTQLSLDNEIGSIGSTFVAIAIFFFAFTSIVSNYYYGETNLQFIRNSRTLIIIYRLSVGAMVMIGTITSLDFVWGLADLFMGLMTLVNLTALAFLGKYSIMALNDYQSQRLRGYNPVYRRSTIPQIEAETECWPR